MEREPAIDVDMVNPYPARSEQTVMIRIGVIIRAVCSGPSHFVKKPLMTREKAFVVIWRGSFGYTLLALRDKNIFSDPRYIAA